MASPENETNVRVLRNRVVEKDGMSTPSKLGTPSKRATPSKLAGEVSGLTTRTRRRLSTKLASEDIAELPQSTVVINKLPDSTPSKRGRKSMDVSCKSPEVVSQENNATGRDSRMNGKDKSPKSEEKTKEDQPTISEKKKAKDDLPTILENEDQSQKSDEKMKDDQPAISEKKRTKDDLPTILENEDSENSIIENSFTLELSITDKAKNDLQKGQLNKSPSVICNPDKNDEETSVNAVSPNTLGKEVVVDSSPAKSISDVGLGESLDSDEQSERTPGKECPSIQEEEESIRSPEQEKKSVEQEKESNEVVDQEKDDSKSRGKKDQSNESVDNEGEEKKMSQLPSQSIESKLEEETDFDGSNNEIVILNEDSNNSVDKCEESSQNIIIEKEPIESIDQANESGLSVIPEECNSADSTLNTESSVILQSPLKDCRSNSESDSNVVSEVVVTLEDNISLENNDPKNICSEVESKGEDSESVGQFLDEIIVNNLHEELVIDKIESIMETDDQPLNNAEASKDDNSTETVPDESETNKLSEISPFKSPMKIQNSPKSSPSNTCSPKKNSSPQKMKDINRLTSPLCQRLPNGDKSPSATNINPTPEKVVSNGNAGDGDKRILDSDSDSDSDDSDSKPQEIPSKDVSQKNSSSKTESFKNKLTPSPQKVMKLIKPIQSEKLMKMKNLMESTFRSQSMSNLSKTAEASPRKASSDSDAVTISRIELTSLINDAVNANATVALLKKDVLELKKDQLELRKELCDLKTLLRKEKEKSKHTKEDNLEEGSVLPNDKKELIDQLLAKQATQIFSESEKSPKKKKSPKKAKESTTVSPDDEEKPLQTNSDSETCPTLVLVTDEPKLKKKKIVEVVEQQDQIDNENDNTNVERKKKRKRKRRNESVEDNVEDIEPTRVDPLASSSTETPVTPDSQSQRPKKKRNRKIKNKNNEELKEKKQREKDVEQTDEAPLNNVVTLHAGINEFEQPHVNEERKKKKKKLAAHVEQIETLSFNNEVSLNSGINEFEQQNVNEARKKKKKKKNHGVQEAELKSHFVDNVSVVPIQSELQSEVNNEVKKKKKKKHEQNDESNWQKSPKNVSSPNQNPLFKIKKQKLKNKLKTKSTLNISKQHVLSYMDEFCDLKPKTDKINLETAKNEVLGSKDSKKFKSKKKNKVCVNDAVESATSKKEVKKSKKEAKDSYKLTPSTSLDVTNFWM